MKLAGRVALVTGSDSGIGQATAITLAREGADVAVHYYTDAAGAQATAEQLRRHGRRAEVFQADLSDPAQAERLFSAVAERLGVPDILVNNAGAGAQAERSIDIPLDDFVRILNLDLVSPWVLCRAAAKRWIDRGRPGVIVNVTSVHEEIPGKGGAVYDAAKAGLRSISRTLGLELAGEGIRINNVAPGMIATPMTAGALSDAEKIRKAAERIPVGRPGEPQEVANVILFLASDEASYVTGSSYFVDGGLTQNVGGV